MQPARAIARACTGEGPAAPWLSTVTVACSDVAENKRSPRQTRSATVGGLNDTMHYF